MMKLYKNLACNFYSYFYGFLLILLFIFPLSLSFLLISPYVIGDYFYNLVKLYGLQLFQNKASMWSALTLVEILLGFMLAYLGNKKKDENSDKKTREALKTELIFNIDQLFTGEIERTFSYRIKDNLLENKSDKIKNKDNLSKILSLYSELVYFERVVKDFRLTSTSYIATEKHLSTCNKFLEFFGLNAIQASGTPTYNQGGVITNNTGLTIFFADNRSKAISIKEANRSNWIKIIDQFIDELF